MYGFETDLALRQRGRAFDPLILFAGGVGGGLYQPGPGSAFQDAGGTVAAAAEDPVGRLADLSGNGNHATQTTAAARPILRQDSGGRWYGHFDGVDDVLNALGLFAMVNDCTIMVALRPMAATLDRALFGFRSDAARITVLYANDTAAGTGGVRLNWDGGNVINEAGTDQNGLNQLLTVRVKPGAQNVRRNGVEVGASTAPAAIMGNASSVQIGAFNNSQRSAFRLYGLLAVGRGLSTAERAEAERYMASRAGVAI